MELSNIQIKRIRNSRSLRLRILPSGEVRLTAPYFARQRDIDEFLIKHKDWIETHTTKIINNQQKLVQTRDKLMYRGKEYLFRVSINALKKPRVDVSSDSVIVTAKAEDHNTVRQLLEKWYKTEAKKYFENRVILLCDVVGMNVINVTIRSQRTRWGSCSSRNTISLNWRLILTPDWVSDYVIYHELAHLTHMNHSDRFWRLVEDYYPNYKKAEKWLKENNEILHF